MNSRVSNLYVGNINPKASPKFQRLEATTGSAVSLSTLHEDTDYVIIDVQSNNVMVRFDGAAATSANGHLLVKEQGLIVLSRNAAAKASFIGSGGTSVVFAEQFVD
tara:strand:- start:3432 stop:3749 length:318 start_codon:yes stop_codon:yes gene_type:complete